MNVAALLLAVLVAGTAYGSDAPTPPCKYEENCRCAAPGVTARWKAAYCMHASETDDFESPPVQECMARPEPAAIAGRSACQRNAHWKAELCRAMHERERDIRRCIKDRKMIPRVVEKGAGG